MCEQTEAESFDHVHICVQQGGATWEFYVQAPDDPDAYIKDCEEHTYEAVNCSSIILRGCDKDGQQLVRLSDAISMAEDCIKGVQQIIE